MQERIHEELVKLQKERDIHILMAIESGSRAWGFPSPDSDFDVRIIYVHKKDWYLSIGERKDNINYFLGKELDINGWELRKVLGLLAKSNATPFEWSQSPIVYSEQKLFRKKLMQLAASFFQPYHSFNHYLGIANGSYQSGLSGSRIKLKKMFYVLRSLLSAKWILNKKSIPPMDIFNLLKIEDNKLVVEKIFALIELKSTANEDYEYDLDPIIKSFFQDTFEAFNNTNELTKKLDLPDREVLNVFFRETLNDWDK